MSEFVQKNSKALRIVQIAFGVIAIVLSFAIIANPGSGIATLVFLLSITLLAAGAERIVVGLLPRLKTSSRMCNIILGIIVIGLGFSVLAYPLSTAIVLVTLLAAGILLLGIARIIQGITNKEVSKWSRAALIGVGILSLAISFIVFAHPVSGLALLIFLLSVNLLLIGIESIVHGISGRNDMVTSIPTH